MYLTDTFTQAHTHTHSNHSGKFSNTNNVAELVL